MTTLSLYYQPDHGFSVACESCPTLADVPMSSYPEHRGRPMTGYLNPQDDKWYSSAVVRTHNLVEILRSLRRLGLISGPLFNCQITAFTADRELSVTESSIQTQQPRPRVLRNLEP